MVRPVLIPVYGPHGLVVDYDPHVPLRLGVTAAEESSRQLEPEEEDGDDVIIYFNDAQQLLRPEVQRRAFETVHSAAAEKRGLRIVIEEAQTLPRETLDVVRDLGRASMVTEVPVHVRRLS